MVGRLVGWLVGWLVGVVGVVGCWLLVVGAESELKKKVAALAGLAEVKEKRTKAQLKSMLNKYSHLFMTKGMAIEGTVKTHHRIQLKKDFKIQHYPPQRLGTKQRETQEEEVRKLFAMGVIRRSSSPWAARMLLVKKPDGSWRPCIDYRGLNAVTVRDPYPLPLIDDVLEKIGTGNVFSKALYLSDG